MSLPVTEPVSWTQLQVETMPASGTVPWPVTYPWPCIQIWIIWWSERLGCVVQNTFCILYRHSASDKSRVTSCWQPSSSLLVVWYDDDGLVYRLVCKDIKLDAGCGQFKPYLTNRCVCMLLAPSWSLCDLGPGCCSLARTVVVIKAAENPLL